jgi:hypothetical protein
MVYLENVKRRMVNMAEIKRTDSGRDVADTLDGRMIRHGETLLLKWPDQQTERVAVELVSRQFERNDEDNHVRAWEFRAVVRRFYRGVQVEVPLVGLEASRAE